MKAAVPTNDGLKMACSYEDSKGFLILDLELGHVVKEEMVWKTNGSRISNPPDSLNLIKGCNALITESISEKNRLELAGSGIEVYKYNDDFITNNVMEFLTREAGKAADYCCCP
jgi:predicted Fe-Mo cluster-binding NifX family protein